MFFAAITFMGNLAHHLKAFFIRFRTGITIIDARQPRHFFQQHVGKNSPGNRTGRASKIIQFNQLVTNSIGNAFPAITNINCPYAARNSIDMFFALLIPYTHALAFNNNAWLTCFKRFVLGQMMPNMGAIQFNNLRYIIIVKFTVHRRSPKKRGGVNNSIMTMI